MTKNIYEALDRVQNETYGKDVRQAIVDAVQQTYDDAAFVGNVNMEVISARGKYPNLKGRLDNMDGGIIQTGASGITSGRPTLRNVNHDIGFMYFDITLNKPIWWNGTVWKDAMGVTT